MRLEVMAAVALLLCSSNTAAQERRFKVSVGVCTFDGVTPVCKTLRDTWVKPRETVNTQGYLPAGTRCMMRDVRSAQTGQVSYLLVCDVNGIELHGAPWMITIDGPATRTVITAE